MALLRAYQAAIASTCICMTLFMFSQASLETKVGLGAVMMMLFAILLALMMILNALTKQDSTEAKPTE